MKVVNSLYNKIYDDDFKFSLCSFLRSFIIEIDDNILAEILLDNNIMKALKLYCKDIYDKLYYLVSYYSENTYCDLIYEIYKVFDIYGKIYKLNDIDKVEDRLNYLLSKADEMSKARYDINDFIDYFNNVKEEGIEITLSSKSSKVSNAVNMLSIHKSKGLEYNICYFPELNGLFRLPELKEKIVFDKEFGIILPFFDNGLVDSYYKILLKIRMTKEEISEKIRLFYVALTRAKDKFILLTKPIDFGYGEFGLNDYLKEKYNSFHSILDSVGYSLLNYSVNPLLINYEYIDDQFIQDENIELRSLEIYDLLIKEDVINKHCASMDVKGVISKDLKNRMEFGTKIHHYFETIDINNYINEIENINESEYIKNKIKKLLTKQNRYVNITKLSQDNKIKTKNKKVIDKAKQMC